MYLRESSRRNKDGSKVTYLQLAHNERHPVTGSPVAKVIHNFGRADKVDREALARLVRSISRVLDTCAEQATVAGGDIEIVDSRRLGGAFVLDQMWDRLGIAHTLRSAAEGRRIDGEMVERICFALVAQRCLEPASKLAAVRWAKSGWPSTVPDLRRRGRLCGDGLLVGVVARDRRADLLGDGQPVESLVRHHLRRHDLHLLRGRRGRRRGRPRPGRGYSRGARQ